MNKSREVIVIRLVLGIVSMLYIIAIWLLVVWYGLKGALDYLDNPESPAWPLVLFVLSVVVVASILLESSREG